jgi:hypothetical protein
MGIVFLISGIALNTQVSVNAQGASSHPTRKLPANCLAWGILLCTYIVGTGIADPGTLGRPRKSIWQSTPYWVKPGAPEVALPLQASRCVDDEVLQPCSLHKGWGKQVVCD